jgi:cobyrinic acid a,c-diamide synthase
MIYPRMKQMIEQETGVPVLGLLPVMDDIRLESRHLGLVLPGEIRDLQNSLNRLADQMEKTVDLEGLLAIANTAPPLSYSESFVRQYLAAGDTDKGRPSADGPACPGKEENVRVGIADDEAFCFHYRDNLDFLREMGAEIVPFSPLKDPQLPGQIRALILPGGYPELYAKELSENSRMLHSIAAAIRGGLPTIAECGGFLYLHKTLAAPDGPSYPAVGLYPWASRYTGHLSRFGYITLTDSIFFGVRVGDVRAHEFHYYESENPGDAFLAVKPTGNRSWRCGYSTSTLYAGFPHLYYYANPKVAAAFLDAAARKR